MSHLIIAAQCIHHRMHFMFTLHVELFKAGIHELDQYGTDGTETGGVVW